LSALPPPALAAGAEPAPAPPPDSDEQAPITVVTAMLASVSAAMRN
jgi:hypothetical protein